MRLNIPTCLTFFRLVLVPFIILTFYLPYKQAPFFSALLFALAAATDWCDGFLARSLKQTTRFGAFLDPVADKIVVIIALLLIVEHYHNWYITLPAASMISREIVVSALREWMAELGKRASVAVSWLGKVKTSAQMVALIALLWHSSIVILCLGVIALYVATALTFWSMLQYLLLAREDLLKS